MNIIDKASAFVNPKITNNPHFLEKSYSDGKNPNNQRKSYHSQAGVFWKPGVDNYQYSAGDYPLPMPIEPIKVLAVMAIAQTWTPEKVYISALIIGIVWLIMGAIANVRIAQENYANFLISHISKGVGKVLYVECGSGQISPTR